MCNGLTLKFPLFPLQHCLNRQKRPRQGRRITTENGLDVILKIRQMGPETAIAYKDFADGI